MSRTMAPIQDHPLRYALANELHARPFPTLTAPSRAILLALKEPKGAVSRSREGEFAHLLTLLDRFGAPHPQPGATHYFGDLGKFRLKWEQHTEFVTYTVFLDGLGDRPFDPQDFETFPQDWLEATSGTRITSALIRVLPRPDLPELRALIAQWFVAESVAVSDVLDASAVIAGDFRIDSAGHVRFAVFADPSAGERRLGRIVQRLAEIETYKTMSMLGFRSARRLYADMSQVDETLRVIVKDMAERGHEAEVTLNKLLETAATLENLNARCEFRFGATDAYDKIVGQRIEALRETRFEGRQNLREFMMRRYDPAIRTVRSTEARLMRMASRAMRAGELLRTQVDVARSHQNQKLLESMNSRSDAQLRLQRTVEGLSVVAISYYAVSLAGYLIYPLSEPLGMSKGLLTAIVTVPIVGAVWWALKRIRNRIEE